jgi:hypothetical protein
MDLQKLIERAASGISGMADYAVIEHDGRRFAVFADGSFTRWVPMVAA